MRFVTLALTGLLLVTYFLSAESCVYNSECKKNSRCISGICVSEECRVNIDCISKGLYFKCSNSRCVPDKHKICRSNDDCKTNLVNKKCQNYKCK